LAAELIHHEGKHAMRLGLFLFTTEDAVNIGTLAEVAEESGIESIWVPEHTHIPADPDTKPPLGGDLPRSYSRLLDPLIALATAAVKTERLKLGTAVTLTASHDPIILAKQIATVDRLSGGRLILGIGSGWNRDELANHGVDFDTRWRRAREHLEAMKAIWTNDEASFAGRWVNFDRIWSWPKPAQKPYPPILFGTIHPSPLVIKHADGWLPLSIAHPGRLHERVNTLRAMAEEAGRDTESLDITVMCLESVDVQQLRDYADAGATRLVVRPPVDSLKQYRDFIDRYADLLQPAI
jgi:probable F420-dependent oxidoreductase